MNKQTDKLTDAAKSSTHAGSSDDAENVFPGHPVLSSWCFALKLVKRRRKAVGRLYQLGLGPKCCHLA